jgi:hypothetical protein
MKRCGAQKTRKSVARVAQPAEVALLFNSSFAGAEQPLPACATFSEET